MSTPWRHTAMILAGAVLLLACGLFTMRTALLQSQGPRGMREMHKLLDRLGGASGLAAHKAQLAAVAARLRDERAAHKSDAGAFSRRIEETFAELGLGLTASSEWKPVPKLKLEGGAAAFERTFAGIGAFDRLLDALATFESWPDQIRVRELSIARHGPGTVAFTLQITAVRTTAQEAR